MYLNTEISIELGRKVHRRYGSWEAARRAGAVVPVEIEHAGTDRRTGSGTAD